VTTRIKLRYRPGLKAAMRVRHRDTIYGIEALIPDQDSGFRHVIANCTSGVHEG
jgi:SPP1 family predicted phage head-tail adaptor